MAKIAPFGRYRAFDSNGDPLNGGKLYTYEAGTTTPKATYVSKNGVANTNPIILDADGYADVWLDTGGYKFVLKSSTDVTLWTVDDIDGGGAAGFAAEVISRSSGFSLTINEQNNVIVCTAALTISLLPAAVAGDGFAAVIINTSAGNVTIDPDGAETINGAASLVVPKEGSATLFCDGTEWFADTSIPNGGFYDDVMLVKDATDTTKRARLDAGSVTAGQTRVLTVQDADGTIYITGGQDVAVGDGGTGLSSYTAGDILYASDTAVLSKLAKGTAGQVLAMNSGATAPSWINNSVVKSVYSENSTFTTITTPYIPNDDTIPQITEGTQVLTATINVSSTTNKVRITSVINAAPASGSTNMVSAVFVNGGANAVAVSGMAQNVSGILQNLVCQHEFTPGATGDLTVTVRTAATNGTSYLNGTDGARKYGGVSKSTLLLEEIFA